MKNPQLRIAVRSRQSGFSMVEMIGVLAIIAILAVIIVPRVFSTIASARITSAANSITALKAPVTDFAGKYGPIPVNNNNSRIDDLLFADGLLEGRFVVKIGAAASGAAGTTWARTGGTWALTGAAGADQRGQSRIICVTSNTTAPSAAGGANYQLSGGVNIPAGSRVISAVIVGATANEARELSLRIDGDAGSTTAVGLVDNVGKVVYPAGNGNVNVYVYIAHQ